MPSNAGDDEAPQPEVQVQVLESLPEEPLDFEAVPRFLEPFGYAANSGFAWTSQSVPELSLEVRGHKKTGGHVYYHMFCSLARPGEWHSPFYSWAAARRLGHLREGLHDPVKRELGDDYNVRFEGVHFAHKVHMKGTTGRLHAWCKKLANCINSKSVTPAVAAIVLRVLLPQDFDSEQVAEARKEGSTMEVFGAARPSDGDAVGAGAGDGGADEVDVDLEDESNPFTTDVLSEKASSCAGSPAARTPPPAAAADAAPPPSPSPAPSPALSPAPAAGATLENTPARSGTSVKTSEFTEYTDSFEPYDGSDTTGSDDGVGTEATSPTTEGQEVQASKQSSQPQDEAEAAGVGASEETDNI